jgi:hypothetical protein
MGTKLTSAPTIEIVQLGELRVKLTSTMPQCMARMVLLDGSGMQIADTVFSGFSNETWQRLKDLELSIEKDFLGVLQKPEPNHEHTGESDESDEPINFRWDG